MFQVNNANPLLKADGKPFRIQKTSADGRPIMTMVDGKPEIESQDGTYADILTLFLNNLFNLVAAKSRESKEIKAMTMEDSTNATDIFRAIHVAEGLIELEKAPYEWLKHQMTTWAVELFGVNAAVVLEPLKMALQSDMTRAEKRRQEGG